MVTGGIDSTLLMYEAKKLEQRPILLSANYGQLTWEKQEELINYHAAILGFDQVIAIDYMYNHKWQLTSAGLFQTKFVPANKDPLGSWDKILHEDYYIEGRNAIMLLYAIAWCSAHQVSELQVGYEYEEDEWKNTRSYKMITDDTSPHFVDAINLLAITGFKHHVRVRAPFLERRMDKKAILAKYKQFNIDIEKTYSCYFVPECGVCENCLLKKDAIKSLKFQ